ncbi:MAG: DUF2304 domain-containing protein [Proteobacteria bacterium]|nr:DUF2304 domain-containing protein [Pseudomonadota bacterium]
MQIVQVIAVLGSLVLFVFVIDFIRRNLLKEKYAVLWISLSIVVTTLSFWKSLLDSIARLVGVAYAPSLLFFVAFIFVLLILLHFSVVISIFHDKNKALTQELAMLKDKVETMAKDMESVKKGRSETKAKTKAKTAKASKKG